ncbi:MAG: DMT family transporter [Burkholderiales bacterium]|nr:DMT family transporter [Burkholderiales bacterium]
MKPRDLFDLLLLGAIWGASFPFMRAAVPEFGTLALIELRVGIGALFLVPIFFLRSGLARMRGHKGHIAVVGIINSALPFCLLAYSTVDLTAGFAAILNPTAALWAAPIAWLWLGDRLSARRVLGLAIGFGGVLLLVWGRMGLTLEGPTLAICAGLAGTFMYGIAASYTKRFLTGVDPLGVAAGSQVAAALALLPLAIATWPEVQPSAAAWVAVLVLGVACTGVAYILYFRLIANAGPARAIAVSYLVPVFGIVWGALFLGEVPTVRMLAACAVILLGTALATGMLGGGQAPTRTAAR